MRANLHLRTSALAIVTILAMLIVPACGSLCASMTHCSSATVSHEPDTCHHVSMSAQSDPPALSTPASCNQQEPPMAILAASDASAQLESTFTAHAPFSIDNLDHVSAQASRFHELPYLKQLPHQSTPLEN